jgi:Na+/H+-dicarboxylate symporter
MIDHIAIILGEDRLMDMMRTVVNVLGDSAAGVAVANGKVNWMKGAMPPIHPK